MAIGLTVHPPGGGEPTELTFDHQRIRIGRGAMCDLRLPHRTVSSVHAMIVLEGDRYFLVDPGSTNGTTLNGELLVIERRKLLRSGDEIGVSGFKIEFKAGVAMVSFHCKDRTAAVARQLAMHVMGDDGGGLRSAALVVQSGPQAGQRFEVSSSAGTMTIGRADDNHIVLDDREASRRHAALDVTPEGVVVRDFGGKNPLLVNDHPTQQHRLKDRDELLVGSTRLVFDEPIEAYLRELAQWPDEPMSESSDAPEPSAEPASERSPEPAPEDDARSDASSSSPDSAVSVGDDRGVQGSGAAGEGTPVAIEPSSAEIEGGGSAPRSEAEKPILRRARGMSAGTEIAVLLVGALALAACILALVWIFH